MKDAGGEGKSSVGGVGEKSKGKENADDRVEEGVGGVVGAAWMDDGPSHLLRKCRRKERW